MDRFIYNFFGLLDKLFNWVDNIFRKKKRKK